MSSSEAESGSDYEELSGSDGGHAAEDYDEAEELPKSKLRAQLPLDVTYDPAYQGVKVSRGDVGFEHAADEESDWSDDGSISGDEDGPDPALMAAAAKAGGVIDFGMPAAVTDDEAKRLQDEFAALEKAEAGLVKGVVPDQNTNIEKAKHIRAQFQLWDALVETRIRLQPVLALANRLPQHTTFNTFKSGSAAERKRAHASCAAAVGELLKLQKSLLVQGKIGDNGEADDTSVGAARKRLKTAAEALEVHEAQHSSMEDYTHETLEKWFTKTNLSRTKTNTKKFRALDRSVMQQVEQVMADKERLLTRTRVKRMPFEVIGKVEAKENGEGAAAAPLPKAAMGAGVAGYDNEIFDDGDHYQDILRELIERKAANTDSSDPVAMGRHWVELNRLRSKVKRKVDTKASKGRKIRYGVHEKLVNFMAPDPNVHPSSDQAKDDLFSSLFQ